MIEPEVALPGADEAPPAGAALVAVLLLVPLLLVVLLLLQPATASAPIAPTRAVSCQPLMGRLPGYLARSHISST